MSRPAGTPKQLSLIGGGRWARVIAGVLLRPPFQEFHLTLHTPSNAEGMREWVRTEKFGTRTEVVAGWPDYDRRRPDAVIVANAARDHVRAATKAVAAGLPTLVEKPMALSEADARALIELAGRRGALLAASQVFRFARYVEAFAREVAGRGPVKQVEVTWTDPAQETRYGEVKRFDPDLQIVKDALPHVASILRMVCSARPDFVDRTMTREGAQADLRLRLDRTPCSVRLSRNDQARRRIMIVECGAGPVRLDFSQEPGQITVDNTVRDGDPAWSSAPRPLALMLQSFLAAAAGGAVDTRLDPAEALDACRIADQATAG